MNAQPKAPSSRALTYADIAVGDAASSSAVVDAHLVATFGMVSGDMNPLHMDDRYAARTQFGGRIAHGMIVGALFSRLIGMHLPGKYSLYLSQTLRFHHPVHVGDELTVRGEVMQKSDALKIVTLRMIALCTKSDTTVVSGNAMVKLLQ